MKKKTLAALLAALMLFSLAGCGNSGHIPGDNPPMMEDIPNQEIDPEWEAEQEKKYDMEQYGLDLSAYDAHGEWSYDRMWVHKTEESWDAVKGYYGYIDREGNLVGEWHEEKTNDNSFENEEFLSYELETAPWLVPGDFQGGYAVILCAGSGSTVASARVEVIDTQGNSVGRFVPDFGTYSYRTDELMVNDFAQKLSEEVLFWDRDMFDVCMSWIESGQFYTRELEGDYMCALDIQDQINGYYPHWYYNDSGKWSYYGLIAENGDHVFGGKMDYEVTKLVPSANDETVSVFFIGVDGREYEVVMDFDGNWLAEPKLVD